MTGRQRPATTIDITDTATDDRWRDHRAASNAAACRRRHGRRSVGGNITITGTGDYRPTRSPSPTARRDIGVHLIGGDAPTGRSTPRCAPRAPTTITADAVSRFHRAVDLRRRDHGLRGERRTGQRADALGQDRQRGVGRRRTWNLFYYVRTAQATGDASRCGPECRRRLHLRRNGGRSTRRSTDDRPHRLTVNGVAVGRCRARARHQRHHPVHRPQRHRRRHDAQPERLCGRRVRLGRDQRQWPRGGVLHQRPAGRDGAGGDGELQRRPTSSSASMAASSRRPRTPASRSSTPAAASSARRSKRPTPTSRRSSPS